MGIRHTSPMLSRPSASKLYSTPANEKSERFPNWVGRYGCVRIWLHACEPTPLGSVIYIRSVFHVARRLFLLHRNWPQQLRPEENHIRAMFHQRVERRCETAPLTYEVQVDAG